MHHGSEDPKSERYMTDGELVHFDLKLNNVLVGDQALDNEHRNQPPYKINDFGLSKKVTTGPQDAKYLKKYQYYSTYSWYAPEQVTSIFHDAFSSRPWTGFFSNIFNPMVRDPHYGTATNI